MTPRTFRAPTMTAALEAVQRELGPEALVISTRQVLAGPAWQVWKQPIVEVVAMVTAKAAPRGGQRKSEVGSRKSEEGEAFSDPPPLTSDLLPLTSYLPPLASLPSALAEAYRQLAAQGVAEELVRRVVASCAETLSPRALEDSARVRDHLRRELEAGLRLGADGTGGDPHATRYPPPVTRIICLVGPGGCGKTTTAAKLAAHHARTFGLKPAWVCADTIRAGAISQARAYAEILRLPLRVAYTPDELAQAVAAEADADLILVDTPGCNPRREADLIELGALLSALPERATYLVASATAKESDLNDALAAFGVFHLTGLVITKLDETGACGNVFNAACRSRLPLAYFATGPRALDDLQPARAARLVGALFGEEWTR
ncbi:MAG: hypothetical protein HY260_13195 [Chloroflexi bacterium]|nr:hypothetical protein [Chloroflexota bacterium]